MKQNNYCNNKIINIIIQMDNEFSNSLDHDDVLQSIESMRTLKKLQKKVSDQRSEEQNKDHILTLQQAKPILSPGIHIGGQFIGNLKYESKQIHLDKTKLSKTAFPGVQFRSWNINKSQLPSISNNTIEVPQQLPKNKMGEDSEFQQFLKSRTLAYRRIDNTGINQTGPKKNKVYSSIFFDSKDKKFRCGEKCLIDQISKILKNREVYHLDQQKLIFNSCFQGGNLFSVFKNPQNQGFQTYQLFLQNDLNTKGCTQWFYFTVRNRIKGKVKFRIMNFYKPSSLYNNGMKILCMKDSQQNPEYQNQQEKYILHNRPHHKHKQLDRAQWKRTGTAIRYYNVQINESKSIYCLQFIHDFDTIGNLTHFSYGYPYNYSIDLCNYLHKLTLQYGPKKIFKKQILCTSCMGNNVYMLSISDNFKRDRKPIIYVIARQHPGQTPASFIVEGLINFLLSSRPEAVQIRQTFLIKIVPMVNVDGVINGNYRSNCSGNDVNRQWDFPSQRIHPQIYHLKKQILSKKKQVVFFLDIHAHSRKMNSFFYSNKSPNNDNKLYPFLCSKINKMIDYQSCTFNDDPSKKTTARVILQNQLNLRNSLTFQCSFYGWEDEKGLKYHFKIKDFIQLGETLGMGFYYSQIGMRKTIQEKQKNTAAIQKQQKKSLSCKLPSEKEKVSKCQTEKNVNLMTIMKNIDKYCQKLYHKWKRFQETQRQNIDKQDAYSEGSSIDPEHFQLKVQEEDFIQKQSTNELFDHQNLQNNLQDKTRGNGFRISAFHGGYRSDAEKSIERGQHSSLIHKKKEKGEYQQFDIPQIRDNSNHRWGWKGNKQAMFIYPTHSNLKNSKMVKQLQSQLQINKKRNQKSSLQVNRLQQHRKYINGTIEGQQLNNYRYNIIQMKKALKYFLENKSTDYEQNHNPFRSSSNDNTINLNEKTILHRSIYHKKKY